ncbi:MAG: hypothetical protein QXR62_05360 [Candidatus Bathyarchaeia archaeon]
MKAGSDVYLRDALEGLLRAITELDIDDINEPDFLTKVHVYIGLVIRFLEDYEDKEAALFEVLRAIVSEHYEAE